MFLKDKYGKKWKLQAAKVLRTGALCVALAGVGTGVMGTLGELGADLGRLGLITAYADEFADRPEEVEGRAPRSRWEMQTARMRKKRIPKVLILPSGWGRWRPMRQSCRITS